MQNTNSNINYNLKILQKKIGKETFPSTKETLVSDYANNRDKSQTISCSNHSPTIQIVSYSFLLYFH